MEFEDFNFKWFNEKVESVEHANWLYKLCCLFLFKPREKLTYGELFMIYYGLNQKALGVEKAKAFSFLQLIKTYKWNNNKEPEMIKNE